ncbi:MAG: UDP-N-acetylglucosamine 1-carboxyvinyltransferase [Caldisericia bacterium]
MEVYKVIGGKKLKGEVQIQGSKNGCLPLISASLLTDEPVFIKNVPKILDILTLLEAIKSIGSKVKFVEDDTILIDNSNINYNINSEEAKKIRGSITLVGALLARFGKVIAPLPGGCHIGTRPINLHLKGFTALGAEVQIEGQTIDGKGKKLKGDKIYFDYPSVGATENTMIAATLATGETIIENAAQEPEIVELANFLNSMGAKIFGAGTRTIRIEGVKKLHGTSHVLSPDRVEAGTFMILTAVTGGDVVIKPFIFEDNIPLIFKLKEVGVDLRIENGKRIRVISKKRGKAFEVRTMPFPGFPTDLQSQMVVLASVSKGVSLITETVFENRFMIIPELKKMGAKIKIEGNTLFVEGVEKLYGTEVNAPDLRAGASLVIAGLYADNETVVNKIYHIERGYYNFDQKIKALGGDIWKQKIEE